MDRKFYKSFGFYLFLLCLVVCGLFIYQLISLNVLPSSILVVGCVFLIVLVFLGFVLLFKWKIVGSAILCLLVVVSSFGNVYLYKTHRMLSDVSVGLDFKVSSDFYLIGLRDFDGSVSNVGVLSIGNTSLQDLAVKKLDGNFDFIEFDSYYILSDVFLNGVVDAVLVSDSSYSLLRELQCFKSEDVKELDVVTVCFDSFEDAKNVDLLNESFTVFISGKDSEDLNTSISRSDVNLLLCVNPVKHEILMVGIPRDFYVEQPCQSGLRDKLTHAGLFGVGGSIGCVEKLFNVPINYYVEVNFNSLVSVVDALDGISVYSPYDFVSLHGDYHFTEGMNHMDGLQALGFVRERYSFEDGDRERSRNQMRVLQAIIDKALSPSIIRSYPKLLDSLSSCFKTNLSEGEITSFVKSQLKHMEKWDIKQIQVNGTGITAVSPALGFEVYMMDPDLKTVDHAEMLIKKVLNNEVVTDSDVDRQNELVANN